MSAVGGEQRALAFECELERKLRIPKPANEKAIKHGRQGVLQGETA